MVLQLLIYLIANRERLVTPQELMDTVWDDTVISESALTKAVARLRKALDDDWATPRYVETVRSQGYRFVARVEEIERRDGPDSPPGKTDSRSMGTRVILSIAAAVSLSIVVIFLLNMPRDETPQEKAIHSLAVLPLNDLTSDPE